MTRQETTSQEAFIIEDGVEVPQSALLRVVHQSGYGSVPGLEDEELADWAELEQHVLAADWGPILALPFKGYDGIRPTIDEFGRLDWGAFGTWDWERLRGPFNRARYKADRLEEGELQWALIMLGVVQERLSIQARLDVLARVRSGVDLDSFKDSDEKAYARYYLRARNLRRKIRELRAPRTPVWC